MEYFCLRFCQISNDIHSSLHSVAPSSVPGGEGFDRSSPRRDDVSRVSQASGERISRALRSKDEPASLHSSPTAANFPPRPPRARSMSATRANSRCPTWRYIPGRFIVGTTGSAPSAAVLAASIAFACPATPIPPHHTRPAGHHPIGQCRDAAGRDGEHLSLSLYPFLFFSSRTPVLDLDRFSSSPSRHPLTRRTSSVQRRTP